MAKHYPVIGRVENKPKSRGVFCKACGEPATCKVHIEVSWFRGEDEVYWSCDNHKNDVKAFFK